MFSLRQRLVVVTASFLLIAHAAHGSVISWTNWTTGTVGSTTGSAQGNVGGLTVSYTGELQSLFVNYPNFLNAPFPTAPQYAVGLLPSWSPAPTFVGGNVGNAPTNASGFVALFGQAGSVNTVVFSKPVVDPVMAFWSLGAAGGSNTGQGRNCLLAELPGCTARFAFSADLPFTIESGGPGSEYGGGSVFTLANHPNVLFGTEGNGVIQFHGKSRSLTWTNPDFESWSGFTIGVPVSVTPVPEPGSVFLLAIGGVGLFMARRGRRLQVRSRCRQDGC